MRRFSTSKLSAKTYNAYFLVASNLASATVVIFIRMLMSHVDPPSQLNLAVFAALCQFLLPTIYRLWCRQELQRFDYKRVPSSISVGLSVVLNILALAQLSAGAFHLLKLTAVPFIVLLNYLFHREKVSMASSLALVLLFGSVGIATFEELSKHVDFFLIAGSGLVFTVVAQILLEGYEPTKLHLTALGIAQPPAPQVSVFLLVLFAAAEIYQPSALTQWKTWTQATPSAGLASTIIFSLTANYFDSVIFATSTPLIYHVSKTIETAIILALSIMIEGVPITVGQAVALLLTIAASLAYNCSTYQQLNATEYSELAAREVTIEAGEFGKKTKFCSKLLLAECLGLAILAVVGLWPESYHTSAQLAYQSTGVTFDLPRSNSRQREVLAQHSESFIDPNDKEELIKHGCFVEPPSQLPLEDENSFARILEECRVNPPSPRCPTPNVFQWVWFGQDFKVHHAVALKSVHDRMKPFAFYVHGDNFPVGNKLWDEAISLYNITLVPGRTVQTVLKKPVTKLEHKSDVIRMEVLLRYGGVYADGDVYILKDLTELLTRNVTIMDREAKDSICNSFIASPRCSTFMTMWMANYVTFNQECWACHSVRLPHSLSAALPATLYVTGDQPDQTFINAPTYDKIDRYIYNKRSDIQRWDWSKNWAVHTYYQGYGYEATIKEWKKGIRNDGVAFPEGILSIFRNILLDEPFMFDSEKNYTSNPGYV